MQFGNLRQSLVLSVLTLGFLAAAEARAADNPIVGNWKWFYGPDVSLESNKTIHINGKKAGVWEAGNFKYKGKTYAYKLVWNKAADGKPHVDYFNLVNENKELKGVNTEGAEVSGERK